MLYPALPVRPAGHLRLPPRTAPTVVADDSAGPRNIYRHDRAGRLLAATDGHGHTQHRRLRPVGQPGRDRRARRRGHPPGVRPARALDPAHPALRRGRRVHLGRRRPGHRGQRHRPGRPAAVTRLRYDGRRADPVGDHRPRGRGHPVRRGRRAGDGGHRRGRGRPCGSGTTPTETWSRPVDARGRGGPDRAGRRRSADRGDHARPGGAPSWCTTRPAGWSSAATRPAAYGGTSTRVAGRLSARRRSDRCPPESRYGRARRGRRAGRRRSAGSPPGGSTSSATWPAVTTAGRRRSGPSGYDALCRLTAWSDPAGGHVDGRVRRRRHLTATVDPTGVREDRALRPGRAARAGRRRPGRHRVPPRRARPAGRRDPGRRHRAGTSATTAAAAGRRHRTGRRDHPAVDYTAAGRLRRIVRPAGPHRRRSTTTTAGRLATAVDGNGRRWQYRYDPDGAARRADLPGRADRVARPRRGGPGRAAPRARPAAPSVRLRRGRPGRR